MIKHLLAASVCGLLASVQTSLANDQSTLVKANFKKADANDDKALNADEFRSFVDLNADDELGRAGMVKRLGMYDQAFARMDADGNGKITTNEIVRQRN